MAELQTLARPYAKAVFDLARESNAFDAWSEVLAALSQMVRMPEVEALVGHPALTRAQQAAVLVEALGDVATPQVRALLGLLGENHRFRLLPAIAERYEVLRAAAESRVEVEITTAAEVAKPQAEHLAAAIGKRLARSVEIHWNMDENLLGGAVIRAGDLVIDGSLKGELQRLSQTLSR